MSKLLIVEDEKKVSAFLEQGLKEYGFQVDTSETAIEAKEKIKDTLFDLIILDVMMPEKSGIEFAKELRSSGYRGLILMLTALSTTRDKIIGLDAGADDYLTKPFDFDELVARVRALIRRNADDKAQLKNGDLVIDLISRQVHRNGIRIDLTSKEFSLLEFLMRNLNVVLDRNAIAEKVWETKFDPDSNVIDVYINHLRKKIDSPFPIKILKTVVGQGYVLKKVL